MGKPLTARQVDTLKPDPDKRQEVPDGLIPGLYLVVQPSGAKSFAARYRHAGRSRKLTLGKHPLMTLSEARDAARETLRQVQDGHDPAAERQASKAPKASGPTVADLAAAYIARHLDGTRGGPESSRVIRKEIVSVLGEREAESLTKADVVALTDAIEDRGAPSLANKAFVHLRAMYRWAHGRDMVERVPTDGMTIPVKLPSRDRVLSDDELRWFWRASESLAFPFGPAFQVLALTGQRRDEVFGMTGAEIDGDVWTIPGARAKNGERHDVPLTPAVRAILDATPRVAGPDGLLFTTTGATPASGYSKAKARVDREMAVLAAAEQGAPSPIPNWRLHDLRRTMATGMAALGVRQEVTEAVLNHRTGKVSGVAAVYNRHQYADEKRAALEAWAKHVGAIVVETV